jgi:hypothetical protein
MFKLTAYPSELIISILTIRIRDLREIQKEMFHMVAWPYLFIFCLLRSPKCDLCEVGIAMMRMVPSLYKLILGVKT